MSNKTNHQSHIDFYKHLSGLGLVTFAGCITLLGIMPQSYVLLLISAYSSLASTAMSVYSIKIIITEGRIPYLKPGPLMGKFGVYVPYKLLMLSLFVVAVVVAHSAHESNKKYLSKSTQIESE